MLTTRIHLARRTVLLALAWPFTRAASTATGTDIAIVVRSDVPVDDLTFTELRKLLLGDRQFWTSKMRVTLLLRAPGARERDVVLKTIYQMSEAQFRQYWIAKVFRAEVATGPHVVYSDQMAGELVAAVPGALAFVEAGHIPKGLKVLKINGKQPGEREYPLR